MAETRYTVKRGDTLSEIAVAYNTTVDNLVALNNITDPDYIVVGQVLLISGTPAPVKAVNRGKPTIKTFGLQSNTERGMYADWSWDAENTDHYEVKWQYYAKVYTSSGSSSYKWFVGDQSTVEVKQSIYTAPENATQVKFTVKAVSKTYKDSRDREKTYWSGSWSTAKPYNFSNNPPAAPPTPTVVIDGYKLTATLDNLDVNAYSIQFQIVKNDATTFKTGTAVIKTSSASYSCTVAAGGRYKVRARSYRDGLYSDWSQYSSSVDSPPEASSGITTCKAKSDTSVYLEWAAVSNATSYELEYATKKEYFDGSDGTTIESGIETTHYEKTGLESGSEYFFRVRAVNGQGNSAWSSIKSVAIGKVPVAPTTWSSTTTVIVGDELILYWVHNAEDGSDQSRAEVEITVGTSTTVHEIDTSSQDEDEKTMHLAIDTSVYSEGAKIQWRVRTAGVLPSCGEWSIQREVDVYAPPTMDLTVTNQNGEDLELLEAFPIKIGAITGPVSQKPIGYHVVVTANELYETVDTIGNKKMVNEGAEVYSKYFDISTDLATELSASDVDLENNVGYTITVTASMDSGLTVMDFHDFTVAWTEDVVYPDAEIAIDEETLAAYITPYCMDENDNLVSDVLLSVYRREYDGRFTEIATGLENLRSISVSDPHPALDYARYRIVAMDTNTGAISFFDIPGYEVAETSIIIQWDEDWTSFDTAYEDFPEEPTWSGSMLKLPYNIDISDKSKADVALIEYIGRKHPVGYYGTQLGETSTWNTTIPKDDVDTLYALRRLKTWMGNVYVREPSGSGYWANISVSFSQKHRETTIPVTLDITRVEGGM